MHALIMFVNIKAMNGVLLTLYLEGHFNNEDM